MILRLSRNPTCALKSKGIVLLRGQVTLGLVLHTGYSQVPSVGHVAYRLRDPNLLVTWKTSKNSSKLLLSVTGLYSDANLSDLTDIAANIAAMTYTEF